MKKLFLTVALFGFGFGAFAQEIRTTEQGPTTEVVQPTPLTARGYKILPEKGDISLGIDLNFLGNYIVDAFNSNATSTNPGYSIYGKYFLTDKSAVRARLGVNVYNKDFKTTIQDDKIYYNSPSSYNGQTVIDIRNEGLTAWNLDLGYEMRRGYRRIQGYFGGELGVQYENWKDHYSYANPITGANTDPSTADYTSHNGDANKNYDASGTILERTLDIDYGSSFTFRAQAFIGVEYFIASRLSVGAEFGLGLGIMNKNQDEITTEKWDAYNGSVVENTVRKYDGSLSGNVSLNTNTRGSIYLMFHF